MDANESRTQTPNLVEKISKLEKQNKILQHRLAVVENTLKTLQATDKSLGAQIAQVQAQKSR